MPANLPPIAAILFDLGGTLFEHLESTTSDSNLVQALGTLNAQLLVRQLPLLDERTFVQDYRRFRVQQELALVSKPFYMHRELVSLSFELAVGAQLTAAAKLDQSLAPIVSTAAANFCSRQRTSVVQDLRPQQDMQLTLQTLRHWGLPMGIVSNIDEDYLQPLVAKNALASYFDFSLSSEQAQSCKPDQKIFAQAFSRLLVHQPAQVLFVGDSLVHDVAGAQEFGMVTALLQQDAEATPPPVQLTPNYTIANLAQVLALVGT